MERTEILSRELSRIPCLLLIRLRSLGDSILSLPLVDALHRWRPDLALDVACEVPFVPVFERHPAVREVLPIRPRPWDSAEGWTRTEALAEIRRRRYPAVLNLHGGTTSLLMTLASGAGIKIGQESFRNSWAYNFRLPPSRLIWNREDLHTVEHQLTLLRWLNLPIPEDPKGALHVDPGDRERMRERLLEEKLAPLRYFVIHPTATLFTKQWQPEKFADLADRLSGRHEIPVVFTAEARDKETLRTIRSSSTRDHHYWTNLELGELFAVIEGCRLFVGNDSGPTHAASALRRPVVVVWGSSNFVAWHPWRTEHELIRSDLPCIPCPGYTCEVFGSPRCILEIPTERVLQACERLLART